MSPTPPPATGLVAPSPRIHPRAVDGLYARWRIALVWITQLFFYGMPWLQWNDRQALLFDLDKGRFYVYGLLLYPQDFFYLTALLVLCALGLFFVTAVAGRIWCGYACPQTVYTEIFLWIEHRFEGDRSARLRLAAVLAVDRLHLRRLLHADPRAVGGRGAVGAVALGSLLGDVLRRRHLRQRRLPARADVHLHLPLRPLPERADRPALADHRLRRRARRAARRPPQERRGPGPGRLHRLHPVRAGLPHRHRHPQGPAERLHRLRRLHRRLRQRDGPHRQAARPDPLRHRGRHGQPLERAPDVGPRAALAGAGVRGADAGAGGGVRGQPVAAALAAPGRGARPRRALAHRRGRPAGERLPPADQQPVRAGPDPAAARRGPGGPGRFSHAEHRAAGRRHRQPHRAGDAADGGRGRADAGFAPGDAVAGGLRRPAGQRQDDLLRLALRRRERPGPQRSARASTWMRSSTRMSKPKARPASMP